MVTSSDILHSLIAFPVAIFLIVVGGKRLMTTSWIRKNGLPAKGFIYDKNGTKLVIRFVTKSGQWITAEHVGAGVFEKGDTLNIMYNPADPKAFLIQNFSTRYLPYLLIIGGIVVIVISILALLHIIPWHT